MKAHVQELKHAQAVSAADDREKKKADMLAEMMAKIDSVGNSPPILYMLAIHVGIFSLNTCT